MVCLQVCFSCNFRLKIFHFAFCLLKLSHKLSFVTLFFVYGVVLNAHVC